MNAPLAPPTVLALFMAAAPTLAAAAPAATPPAAATNSPAAPAAQPTATPALLGIEGRVTVRRTGPPLLLRPIGEKPSVLLRFGQVSDDPAGSANPDTPARLYELIFIPLRTGRLDLREHLMLPGNRPVDDGQPILISVSGLLPDNHTGDLTEFAGVREPWLGGYRLVLISLGVLWLVPPAWWLVRRLTRPGPAAVVPPAPPPTLADLLRPLVEAVLADPGAGSTAQRARLERLLVAHWRDRLKLSGVPHARAVSLLRSDASAGEVLRNLDQWLHAPRGPGADGHAPDHAQIGRWLAPYAAVDASATLTAAGVQGPVGGAA